MNVIKLIQHRKNVNLAREKLLGLDMCQNGTNILMFFSNYGADYRNLKIWSSPLNDCTNIFKIVLISLTFLNKNENVVWPVLYGLQIALPVWKHSMSLLRSLDNLWHFCKYDCSLRHIHFYIKPSNWWDQFTWDFDNFWTL